MVYLVHAVLGGAAQSPGPEPGGIKGMMRSETAVRMVEAGSCEADVGNYICVNLSGGLRKLSENKDGFILVSSIILFAIHHCIWLKWRNRPDKHPISMFRLSFCHSARYGASSDAGVGFLQVPSVGLVTRLFLALTQWLLGEVQGTSD